MKKMILRVISLFIMLSLLIACLCVLPVSSAAVKKPTSHDIAIVFDNSGSMYENDRWCQAIYAMEVFASMLDYDKDKLGIYPMAPISIGKDGSKINERLDISKKEDVKNIEHIYSPTTTTTILKPAYSAAKYLEKSDYDEKWLIVLTDGAFIYDQSEDEPELSFWHGNDVDIPELQKWLTERMENFAKKGINVQYLGFGEAAALNGNDKNFFADTASSSEALTQSLVNICNMIFKRNVVSDVSSDGNFSIDVSMNSIIAFVQGSVAKINQLNDPDGKAVKVNNDIVMSAAQEGTGDKSYDPAPVADVSGQVVTFDSCQAGTYQLDYTGSNVQVFYEPNVTVSTALYDKDGNEVDLKEDVLPGAYTLKYGLVDSVTGEDVSNSKLLAPVALSATVTNNGVNAENVASGAEINLTADPESESDTTVIDVRGTFLNDYSISNEDEAGKLTINVVLPESGDLDVHVDVTTKNFGRNWYKLSDHEKWTPIRVDVTYNGEPLSDEALSSGTVFSVKPEDKNMPYRAELIPGESVFNVYIGDDGSGEYTEPDKGRYSFTAEVTYTDEYGRDIVSHGSNSFEVRSYSSIWRWLIWVVLLAALAVLTFFILNLPAWPRRMRFVVEKPKVDEGLKATIKIRSTGMPIVPYEDALRCSAAKNSKIKDRLFKPKSMSIVASNFSSEEIRQFKTGGHTYSDSGDGFVCRGIENEIIFNGSQFEFTFLNGTKGSGHIEIY